MSWLKKKKIKCALEPIPNQRFVRVGKSRHLNIRPIAVRNKTLHKVAYEGKIRRRKMYFECFNSNLIERRMCVF